MIVFLTNYYWVFSSIGPESPFKRAMWSFIPSKAPGLLSSTICALVQPLFRRVNSHKPQPINDFMCMFAYLVFKNWNALKNLVHLITIYFKRSLFNLQTSRLRFKRNVSKNWGVANTTIKNVVSSDSRTNPIICLRTQQSGFFYKKIITKMMRLIVIHNNYKSVHI